ncbi:MAG: hypothetical protein IIY72_07155 [Solobacterium sp.]|nr:hypothetical protein [Solobacterium sp.]
MKIQYRLVKPLLCLPLVLVLAGCEKQAEPPVPEETPADTGYHDPLVELSEDFYGGRKTTWQCVTFGSYPAQEIISGPEYTAVDGYAVDDSDYLADPELYAALEQAEWTGSDLELNGERYRRISREDTISWAADRPQHYRWDDETPFRYFAYKPIRWRIIEVNGDVLTLMADRLMDCSPYHTEAVDVTWQDSAVRSFLNGYDSNANLAGISYALPQDSFYGTAFSAEEKTAVLSTSVENKNNYYFGTDCGEDTEDYVYLLSEAEVFASEAAERHGFYPGDGIDDPARRFRPTVYAMARGTWYSPVEYYRGNGFWFMRTSGYTPANVTYICDFGYIYNRGTYVTCNDSGLLPVIRVDSTKAELQDAGMVSSTDIQERQEKLN